MNQHPLNDAMSPRPLAARWVIRGTLTLETALHLGGEAGEQVDMPVLRDARDGRPLLPGTTLAGALRSALADRLAGYEEPEPPEVAALFGGAAQGDDDGSQSPLIVFDALGEIPPGHGVEIRDGVAISALTGTAEDHKKYDYEVLPAGTTFAVRADLLLPAPASRDGATPPDEKSLLEALAAALDAFAHGQSAFGAKRSRGLGRVSAVWAARRFDLGSAKGWVEWTLSDHERPFAANPDQSCIRDALEQAAPEALRPLELPGDRRDRVVIDVDLRVAHDILVRSPGTDPAAPDVSHLHSGGTAILPGTSLAGVMRTQALRIATLVRAGRDEAELWVDRLFGPRFEGQRPSGKLKPRAARIRVDEARFEGSQPQRQTRVAIDRFTQGVVDTALFDEQMEVGGRATARLELRNPEKGELGLVLLVLKDLLDGSLPVGGTSSVGRGVLRGMASVTWHEGDRTAPRSAKIQPGRQPAGEAAGEIDEAIRAFHQADSLASTPSEAGAAMSAEGAS
ncbi:MAG: hypothetical protein HYV63_13010 [Candidatus Schekmanbacteria bacterium]|nr:hypothetical protein [Candidatus Schekmanbacteria bacterium]